MKPLYISHRDDTKKGGEAPIHAHMALQTGEGIAGLTPIPEGAHLFFIENPRKANTIIECILRKVIFENGVFKGIELVAYSKSWKSTRRLFLTAAWDGTYHSALRKDDDKVEAAIEGKPGPR